MADLIYVRNARPNVLIIKFAGLKFPLERRGNREDSTALPAEASSDGVVNRLIRNNYLEVISKEAFMELGVRTEDKPFAIKQNVLQTGQTDIIMNDAKDTEPTIITNKTLTETAHLRSPNPEFAGRIPSTDEELGFVKPELDETQIDEIKALQAKIAELEAQVLASDTPEALEAVSKPAVKKRTPTKKTS